MNKKQKWDIEKMSFETKMNNRKKEKAKKFFENIVNDSKREERLEYQLCKVCFYQEDSFSLQVFHTVNCGKCGKEMIFSSSRTDILCQDCAKDVNCCEHCGAKMD